MSNKKIFIIGQDGMLGGELTQRLELNTNYEIYTTTLQTLDICDKTKVQEIVQRVKPDVIINCAAYTNVDGCESNIELSENVNGKAVENIAEAANSVQAELIQISTDYVFDGNLDKTKEYTEDMQTNPISMYGKTKLLGEENAKKAQKHYILRTAWLYGNGKNFVRTMLKLAKEHDEIKVVCDQVGSPTSVTTLCDIIEQIIEKKPPYGIYHCTNEGFVSWYEFARKIFEIANISINVIPVKSEEYKTIAIRPKNSKLSKQKLHDLQIYPANWEKGLEEYLKKEIN